MKRIKVPIVNAVCVLLGVLLFPNAMHGQSIRRQCISSYGATAVQCNVLLSQTVGQVFITKSETREAPIVLQGFQQPSVYAVKSALMESTLSMDIKVFPNPAIDIINIKSNELINNALVYVTDIAGRQITSINISMFSECSVNSESWDNGIYFINIFNEKALLQTIRIVKTK